MCYEYGKGKLSLLTYDSNQSKYICDHINQDANIGNEFNLYGESHGAHLAHVTIISGCLQKKVRNFVSNSGPLRGVAYQPFEPCDGP